MATAVAKIFFDQIPMRLLFDLEWKNVQSESTTKKEMLLFLSVAKNIRSILVAFSVRCAADHKSNTKNHKVKDQFFCVNSMGLLMRTVVV